MVRGVWTWTTYVMEGVTAVMGVTSHPRPVSTAPPWRVGGCARMGASVYSGTPCVMARVTAVMGVTRWAALLMTVPDLDGGCARMGVSA